MARMMSNFPREKVKLIKANNNGESIDDIEALITKSSTLIENTSVIIEEGDYIVRTLPNGLTEKYIVIDNGFHIGNGGNVPDHYQVKMKKLSNVDTQNESRSTITSERTDNMKKPMIFISHASADKEYVELIVELLADIGLNNDTMFCSSVSDYGIPMGKDIYDYLKDLFDKNDLHVLFILSDNYYNSAACLNEMGAAWVLKKSYSTILLPGFDFKDIKGAVNPRQVSLKLDSGNNDDIKKKLGELKNMISKEFKLSIPDNRWEKKRDNFISDISEVKTEVKKNENDTLIIQNEKLDCTNQITITTTHFSECKTFRNCRENCINKLKSLQNNYLPPRKQTDCQKKDMLSGTNPIYLSSLSNLCDAGIADYQQKAIYKFALENGIEIVPEFWNLGDLKKPQILIMSGGGNVQGSNEEIQRYNSIVDLYFNIKEYQEYKEYFSVIDKQFLVGLVMTNAGNAVDEDIDVKLKIAKGLFIRPENMKTPGKHIIENILERDFLECAYTIRTNDKIMPYPEYPPTMLSYSSVISNPFARAAEEYNRNIEEFNDKLNRIFCYNYYNDESYDILSFHIGYLKHNTTIAFPSVLAFKEIPNEIEYEISSKYKPKLIKGKIKIIYEN